jgi:hypothetical protein
MDGQTSTILGHFPLHDAYEPSPNSEFNPSGNWSLERIAQFIMPPAYPPFSVSSVTAYTPDQGPNPVYTVEITGEAHPVKLFGDSFDAMYVEVPLIDNPRVTALVTSCDRHAVLADYLQQTSITPSFRHATFLSRGPIQATDTWYRVLYRSTGPGPDAKHMIFSAYKATHITSFLEVYLDLPNDILTGAYQYYRSNRAAYMDEHFPLMQLAEDDYY